MDILKQIETTTGKVAIDIAILGIAYPIIVDKISNIGQKFSSDYLANAFEDEFPQTKFLGRLPLRSRRITVYEWILFITIGSFVLLILNAQGNAFFPVDGRSTHYSLIEYVRHSGYFKEL